MTYYANNGDIVSAEQIKAACDAGTAKIIHSYNPAGGMCHALALDAVDFDTRGQNYQMGEDCWTTTPTVSEALKAARGA